MSTQSPINPFQPPAHGGEVVAAEGSLQKAVAGDYDFEIGDVLREAWELSNGFKGTFWGAALVGYLIMIVAFMILGAILGLIAGSDAGLVVSLLFNVAITAGLAPLIVGVLMLGVLRASGRAASFNVIFGYFDKMVPLAGAYVLSTLLTYVGLIFLLVPGIYLGLAYGMTLPLVADRNLPIWQAMETSRKALTHKWFRLFGTYCIVGLLVLLSAIPLGIGLIWTVPWSMLVMGVLYRRIFGAAAPSPDA